MWWLFLPGALGVCAVLAIGAAVNSGPKHPRHAEPRHLRVVRDDRGQVDGYGSMVLAEERTVAWDPPAYLLAAPVDPEPWRARTMAELSPEALDSDVQPDPYLDPIAAEHGSEYDPADPGAGDVDVVSSAPAPDPHWLEAQMAATFNWAREARVRLAAI